MINSPKYPASGSFPTNHLSWLSETDILQAFGRLQQQFAEEYKQIFSDRLAQKAVVIIPSLTLDEKILSRIDGIIHYEERLLCMLLLLRMPNTHLVYVTSTPIDPVIVDYYLHLLPGVSPYHARQRLTLLCCYDHSPSPLTKKILDRPRLIERIRQSTPNGYKAHLSCFIVTELERQLAVALDIPVFGCDPSLSVWGTKSNSRHLFRSCGLKVPAGYEDLHNEAEISEALINLKLANPALSKAVIKMNDGFSGDGNAIFTYPEGVEQDSWQENLRRHWKRNLKVVARELDPDSFLEKFERMQGVVEEFIEGKQVMSPSVQCRIDPLGSCHILSTHDQVLAGEGGQVYQGASFPARQQYAPEIAERAKTVARELQKKGVIGRFGVDFLSVKNGHHWDHYAIEINLRKGGTTHPYLMLEFLTDGHYEPEEGIYYAASGQPRYYYATDNLSSERYKGLTPHDLIDIAAHHNLMYNGATQQGVMFHLIGALSEFGKLGLTCIGDSPATAIAYYNNTIEVLDRECSHVY